jgi:hypothetical protein
MTLEYLASAKQDYVSELGKNGSRQSKMIATVSFDEMDAIWKKVCADFYLR